MLRMQSRGSSIACAAGEVEAAWWGLDGVGVVGHCEDYGQLLEIGFGSGVGIVIEDGGECEGPSCEGWQMAEGR